MIILTYHKKGGEYIMSINSSTYKKVLSKGIQNNLPDIENGKLRFYAKIYAISCK